MERLETIEHLFNQLTKAFENHNCEGYREGYCSTCESYIDTSMVFILEIKKLDAPITEKMALVELIRNKNNQQFNYPKL